MREVFFINILLLLSCLDATEIKIASYNVENLFDVNYDSTEYQEYIPNKNGWTWLKLNKKLTNISEAICDIDADIIALEEIENKNALRLLQKSLKRYGCDYRYSTITYQPKSAIELALLSKIPIEKSKSITVSKTLRIRDILEVKFVIDDMPLYIFVNHWSSKKSSDRKRILSASKLKERLERVPKGSEYIVLGDFNADYNERKIFKILGIGRECDIKKDGLFNLWFEKPIYKRWSYKFYWKRHSFDAILIPHTLIDGEGIDYIKGSFNALRRKYLFHKGGLIFRWDNRRVEGYSDHLPIFAKFSTTKKYEKSKCRVNTATIRELHDKNVDLPLRLVGVKVISKKRNKVTIRQGRDEISIYGIDSPFIINEEYNITVYKRAFYNNSYEIVDYGLVHFKLK